MVIIKEYVGSGVILFRGGSGLMILGYGVLSVGGIVYESMRRGCGEVLGVA